MCFRSCTLKQVSLEDDTVRHHRQTVAAVGLCCGPQWRPTCTVMQSRQEPAAVLPVNRTQSVETFPLWDAVV